MALDASADGERGAVGSLFGQLLKKPSQEQIVLLLTVALLVSSAPRCRTSPPSKICSTWCAASPFSAFSGSGWG